MTKLRTKQSAKVETKSGLILALIIGLAGLSFFIANLIKVVPQVGRDMVAASTPPELKDPATIMGYCVTSGGLSVNGHRMSMKDCLNLNVWYLFCEDRPDLQRTQQSCYCPNGIKSALLESYIDQRDSLILDLNDGTINSQDLTNQSNFRLATTLKCACPVYHADNQPTNSQTVMSGPLGVIGTFNLVSKAGILFSKMSPSEPDAQGGCRMLPSNCSIQTDSRSPKVGSLVPVAEPYTDPHTDGLAFDISCGETETTNGTGCGGQTKQALDSVMAANPGFNIIQECTVQEGNCNHPQASPRRQVLHLDLFFQTPRPNTGGNSCLFQNCQWPINCTSPVSNS